MQNSNNSCSVENLIESFKQSYPVELWKELGLFEEDYINNINIHWLTFPPPKKSNHYILAVMYAIIMVVGMTGNVLVIALFVR